MKKTNKCLYNLPMKYAEKAFAHFRQNPDYYIKAFAEKGILPNVMAKIPGYDFEKWTLEEWATFLTFYLRGKRSKYLLYFIYPNVEE